MTAFSAFVLEGLVDDGSDHDLFADDVTLILLIITCALSSAKANETAHHPIADYLSMNVPDRVEESRSIVSVETSGSGHGRKRKADCFRPETPGIENRGPTRGSGWPMLPVAGGFPNVATILTC